MDPLNLAMTAFLVAGTLLYGLATALFYIDIAHVTARRTLTPPPNWVNKAPALLLSGALFHLAYIVTSSFLAHVCPIDSVHFMLSLVAVLTSLTYLVIRLKAPGAKAPKPTTSRTGSRMTASGNLDALGLVIAPLSLAVLLGTHFFDWPSQGRSLGSAFLTLHVLANLVGMALFVLAAAAAGLYLLQERRLKQKQLKTIGKLPPLDTLDRALHRFLLAGFPLLTVGIITGTFWTRQLEFGTANEVMRIVFGYATWLLIACVLLLRIAAGWRGRRSAYGTILGLICASAVLLAYVTRESVPPAPSSGPAESSNRPQTSLEFL